MPVTNMWTQQKPLTAVGTTGAQSIKHIPGCRVFVKTKESTTAAPVYTYAAYSNKTFNTATGVTTLPVGWNDLGIMLGSGKITYTKNKKKVQTGPDKVTRAVYVDEKSAELEFNLSQFDDYVMTQLGFNSSIMQAGSAVNFQIGSEDIVEKALLMVYSNKLDGKEIQWYHPAAQISATPDEVEDGLALKVNAELVAFTPVGATVDSLVSCTFFA